MRVLLSRQRKSHERVIKVALTFANDAQVISRLGIGRIDTRCVLELDLRAVIVALGQQFLAVLEVFHLTVVLAIAGLQQKPAGQNRHQPQFHPGCHRDTRGLQEV